MKYKIMVLKLLVAILKRDTYSKLIPEAETMIKEREKWGNEFREM